MDLKVGLIFAHRPPEEPTWPTIGYDYEGKAKNILSYLRERIKDIEFLPFHAKSKQQAEEILKETREKVVGYVVYILGIWTLVPETIAKSGKPTVIIDDLFAGSGEFLVVMTKTRKEKLPVIGIASSNKSDIVEAINFLKPIGMLRQSKIVSIIESETHPTDYESSSGDVSDEFRKIQYTDEYENMLRTIFGIKLEKISADILNDLMDNVPDEEANKIAKTWINSALKVVEPSEKEILKSAKMYIAMREILRQRNAQAITINCLKLFFAGKLRAYPCLGFSQLLDDGLVGTCEADLDSAVSQLIAIHLTGRPGFISDPVINQSDKTITYAHCVAPTKVYGPSGPKIPYIIRSHAEDQKGAALQALYPIGESITTFKVNVLEKAFAIHSGTIVANSDEPKACRTKVVAKADTDAILENWNKEADFDWHRVSVVGDYREKLINFARLLGLRVIEEDRK